MVALVPGGGRMPVHFLLVGSKSRQAISGRRVPATDWNIWFMYFMPSLPHFVSMMSLEHLRIRFTAQHISKKGELFLKFRKKEFKDFSTRNSLLHIGVDGLVEGDGQIAHAASSLLLRRVEAGGVLQVLLPLLAALLAAELIVPAADVALGGDGADKLSH